MTVRSSDDVPRQTLLRRFPAPRNFNVAAESRIDTYEIDRDDCGPMVLDALIKNEIDPR